MTNSITAKIADREMMIRVGGSTITAIALAAIISYLIATHIYHIPLPQVGIYIGSVSAAFISTVIIGVIVYLATRNYPEEIEEPKVEEKLEQSLNKSLNNSGEFCAITFYPLQELKDGVRTPDGQLYERSAIEQWIDAHGTNPKTREPLSKTQLTQVAVPRTSSTLPGTNIEMQRSVDFRATFIE